jgi:hypothetical protein
MCVLVKLISEATKAILLSGVILLCALIISYLNDQALISDFIKLIVGVFLVAISIWIARIELSVIAVRIYSYMQNKIKR